MKVVVLCGGYGTRLSGAGADLPKPMTPIGGRPIVWHVMRGLAHWGFTEFVLALGYRSDVFKHYFLNLPTMVGDVTVDLASRGVTLHGEPGEAAWRVTLAETGLDSMTGARVARAAPYLGDDDLFAVTYGDGVTDLDFREVVAFHRAHGRLATVTAVRPPARFGELVVGEEGRVSEFNEKPQASSGWISGGFFVFSRGVLDRLSTEPSLVLEREPLQRLARDGELVAYRHPGFWFCMDTPRDYQQLSEMWAAHAAGRRGGAPWVVWEGV